jgi:hypothetical protein
VWWLVGSGSNCGNPKTIKLVFAASLLSMQHQGVKAKTGSLALNQGSVSKWSDMSTHRLDS